MNERDSKSSEDRIREARERIRGDQTGEHSFSESELRPPPTASPSLTSTVPEADPGMHRSTVSDPVAPQTPDLPAQTPSRGGSIWGSAVIRLIVGGLIFGGWMLFTSLDDANRDSSGEIVGGGDLDVMTMQPGDCFDDPDSDVVFDVAAVPCSQAHDNEVFYIGSVGSTFGETWPGLTALDDFAYDTCVGGAFDGYVGTSYQESSLGVFTLTPTEESWDEGDRGYVCALYSLDFAPLTSSVRSSGA